MFLPDRLALHGLPAGSDRDDVFHDPADFRSLPLPREFDAIQKTALIDRFSRFDNRKQAAENFRADRAGGFLPFQLNGRAVYPPRKSQLPRDGFQIFVENAEYAAELVQIPRLDRNRFTRKNPSLRGVAPYHS